MTDERNMHTSRGPYVIGAAVLVLLLLYLGFRALKTQRATEPEPALAANTAPESTPTSPVEPARSIAMSMEETASPAGPGVILGRVFTIDGEPGADATVVTTLQLTLGGPPSSLDAAPQSTTCDGQGNFALRDLPLGYHRVIARLGESAARGGMWLRANSPTAELFLVLRPGMSAAGVVEDEAAVPIAGALLEPVLHDGEVVYPGDVVSPAVRTDEQGHFAFLPLEPKTWEVCVTAEGYGPLRAPLDMGSTKNKFVLHKGAGITGHVLDAIDNSAIPGVVVAIRERDIEMTPVQTRTGPDGQFAFPPVQPGRYILDVESAPLVLVDGPVEVDVSRGVPGPLTLMALPGGTVTGYVLDELTREPIAGVHVRAWSSQPWVDRKFSPATGEDGAFTFTGLPGGEYKIRPSITPGYGQVVTSRKYPVINVLPGDTVSDVEVLLVRGATISGTVVDPEGNPVAGAEVRGSSREARWQDQCDSAADGTFLLSGLEAEGDVVLSAKSMKWVCEAPITMHVTQEGARDITIPMELERSASVAGIVVNRSGQPVHAQIFAESTGNPAAITLIHAESASDGRFLLSDLYEGEFNVSGGVRDNGPRVPLATLHLQTGEVLRGQRWVMSVGDLSVEGRVVDEAGQPVAAQIDYRQRSEAGYSVASYLSTRHDGTFTIEGIDEGEILLTVRADGYGSQATSVRAGDTDVVIVMEAPMAIRGHVLDAQTHAPIASFQVAAVLEGTDMAAGIPGNAAFRTVQDPTGVFAITLEPGRYVVAARATGYTTATEVAVLYATLESPEIEFALEPGGASVEGRVADEAGAAVPGALVFVGPLPQHAEFKPSRSNARTDNEGAFRIEGLPPGPIELSSVHAAKGGGSASANLRAGEVSSVSIVLSALGSIEGTVTYASRGLSGATVSITMDVGMSARAVTDSSGDFNIKGVPPGTGALRIELPSTVGDASVGQPISRSVAVESGQTIRIDVDIPEG